MRKKLKVMAVVPSLTVAGTYASGDQVGAVNQLVNAVDSSQGQALVRSITIIDAAKQDKALDIFFFNDLPVLASIDNGAFNLTDAEMLAKCIGCVSIVAADYHDASVNSVATKQSLSLVLQAAKLFRDIYCVVVARDTPTYTNGDLKILLGLEAS